MKKESKLSMTTRVGPGSNQREERFSLPPCPCPPPKRAARLRGSLDTASSGPPGATFTPHCNRAVGASVLRESGFALVWWALFISLVAFPLLVLVVEGGRYFRAAGDVQKAADAAAEAAVREVDIPHYLDTGEVRFSGNEYALAHDYANANASFLRPHGTDIAIVAIQVDEANDTVLVTARADVTLLFPQIAPQILIQRTGVAQVRLSRQ